MQVRKGVQMSERVEFEQQRSAPVMLEAFEKVERRIKGLIEEKRQLQQQNEQLARDLEQERLKVSELEKQVTALLRLKEKYQTFMEEQETVRAKVDELLSLLGTED